MLIFLLPLEPPFPAWATDSCVQQVENIVQHEVGSTNSIFVYEFVAQQVIYDIPKYGCRNLTQWRWKIGAFNNKRVKDSVRDTITNVLMGLYKHRYPPCKFIGYPADIPVWESYGYRIRVDYKFNIKGFTVIGTNCK